MMIVNQEIEFAPVYFNSVAKTAINHRFKLDIFSKKFHPWFMFGLMMDLVGMLN